MTQQLYANLHPSSKYAAQATPKPFPVDWQVDAGGYVLRGNSNQYRLSDLVLYFKTDSGFKQMPAGEWLVRSVVEELQDIETLDLSDIENQHRLYNFGQYGGLRNKLEQLLEKIPQYEPTCGTCKRSYTRCVCTD